MDKQHHAVRANDGLQRKGRKSRRSRKSRAIKARPNLKINGIEFPAWMDCTWRRVTCDKDSCPICGRIKKDRKRHEDRGEDPDDMEMVLEDVSRNFKEVFKMIKADAKKHGIDIENLKKVEDMKEPPEPEDFPLYRETIRWYDSATVLIEDASMAGQVWVDMDRGQDIAWYGSLLPAKVYRQLCNDWMIKNRQEYGDFDYEYTSYVLKECLEILQRSLLEFISFGEGDDRGAEQNTQKKILTLYSNLKQLGKKIHKI